MSDIRVGVTSANTSSGTNANVAITLVPRTGGRTAVAYITWSYDAAPTGGRLTITMAGTVVFDIDITAAGPGALRPVPLGGGIDETVVVTLYAGGVGIKGKLNAYAGSF